MNYNVESSGNKFVVAAYDPLDKDRFAGWVSSRTDATQLTKDAACAYRFNSKQEARESLGLP